MVAVAARVVDETRARIRPPVCVVGRNGRDVGLVAVRRDLEEQAPRDPSPIHVEVHPIVAARERGHLATLCPIAPPLPPLLKCASRDTRFGCLDLGNHSLLPHLEFSAERSGSAERKKPKSSSHGAGGQEGGRGARNPKHLHVVQNSNA